MSAQSIYRWRDGALEPLEYCDMTATAIVAADSWLVTEGNALALDAHHARFLSSIPGTELDAAAFWDAAIALIPREGDWFPRVEWQRSELGGARLIFRLRSAPERRRSVRLATWPGDDPRSAPLVKGPDLESLLRIRTSVQPGADEAVLLSPDGYVAEGATTALLWWRGEILCGPPADLDWLPSVTARSVLTLATALGFETYEEAVTPTELDGTELWALNALHGIRIATKWIDGPGLAEKPGRLAQWRTRLGALRKPI